MSRRVILYKYKILTILSPVLFNPSLGNRYSMITVGFFINIALGFIPKDPRALAYRT